MRSLACVKNTAIASVLIVQKIGELYVWVSFY